MGFLSVVRRLSHSLSFQASSSYSCVHRFTVYCILFKEALKKRWLCEHAHTSLGSPPLYCERLRLFFPQCFLICWRCLVRCETNFVPFLVHFYQNKAKQRDRKTAKIWQFKGERVDFDGQINQKIYEVLSSSWSLAVRPSVRWSVGWLVGHVCEKVTFRVSKGD